MSQWARLYSKVSESEHFAMLHAQDETAALLFLLAIPHAAPWGILPGSPFVFKSRVCAMLDIGLDKVKTCLRLIVDAGLWQEYQDRTGKPLLYVRSWNENQPRQWDRLGPPEFDFPPGWEPPIGLGAAILAAERGKRPLSEATLLTRIVDAESKTSLRRVIDQSRKSAQGQGKSLPREGEGEGEGKGVTATPTPKAKASPPADADGAPKHRKPPVGRPAIANEACLAVFGLTADDLDDAQWKKYAAAMATVVGDTSLEELEAWIEEARTDPRVLGTNAKPERKIPALVRAELKATAQRKVWDKADSTRGKGNGEFILLTDGRRHEGKDWTPGDALEVLELQREGNWNPKTGRTLRPRRRWCCDDGNAYPDETWPEGVPM